MRTDGKYFYWRRSEREALSASFSTDEFNCHCNYPECCGGEQRVSCDLVARLQAVRDQFQLPLSVSSGYRCSRHQAELREAGVQTADGLSQHELGNAADVVPKLRDRSTMRRLLAIAEQHFRAIGVARGFLHLDTRADKSRRWSY
jgi:uncharacterized protein YcbK (DUF882 family)